MKSQLFQKMATSKASYCTFDRQQKPLSAIFKRPATFSPEMQNSKSFKGNISSLSTLHKTSKSRPQNNRDSQASNNRKTTQSQPEELQYSFKGFLSESKEVVASCYEYVDQCSAVLGRIRSCLERDISATAHIQQFLESTKLAAHFELIFQDYKEAGVQKVFQLLNLSFLLVLFILNYVDIAGFKAKTLSALNLFLKTFDAFLSVLKLQLGEVSFKDLIRFSSVAPEFKVQTVDPSNLDAMLLSCKFQLLQLIKVIYRSEHLCLQLEELLVESAQNSVKTFFLNSFRLFEQLAQNAFGPQESEQVSFSCDEGNPNFIIQPLPAEKYLPDKSELAHPYTLVLDLDETLVHFEENPDGGEFLVRPHATEFLQMMSSHFELVIFTAALKEYADWILDRIDPARHISHRLYRQHTQPQNGVYIKDLSRLGRSLAATVIVDNNMDNFQL